MNRPSGRTACFFIDEAALVVLISPQAQGLGALIDNGLYEAPSCGTKYLSASIEQQVGCLGTSDSRIAI